MRDRTLDVLLVLDGQVLVVDPEGRSLVRFVVTRVPVSAVKPHGLDYSLNAAWTGWREAGRFRQRASGVKAEAWRAAGPSPPAADGQGLRIPGRSDLLADFSAAVDAVFCEKGVIP